MVLLGSLLVLPSADACKCWDPPPAVTARRPEWVAQAGLILVEESVELRCSQGSVFALDCVWESVHVFERVEGAGLEPLGPTAGWVVMPSWAEIEVRIGERTFASLSHLGMEEPWRSWLAEGKLDEYADDWSAVPLEDPGGARVEVVVSAKAMIGQEVRVPEPNCCRFTPLDSRHWFADMPTRAWVHWLPQGDVAADLRTHVEIELPRSWRVQAVAGVEATRDGDRRRLVVDLPSGEPQTLALTEPGLRLGGPVVGFGGGLGDYRGFRARIGWEQMYPELLGYSAMLETNFIDNLVVVPAVEVSHPIPAPLFFLPQVGLGIGAPVQILPDARVGLRGLGSLTWPFVSFVFAVDWYPATRALQQSLGFALYGQVGF